MQNHYVSCQDLGIKKKKKAEPAKCQRYCFVNVKKKIWIYTEKGKMDVTAFVYELFNLWYFALTITKH